jgi:hypothetical protein
MQALSKKEVVFARTSPEQKLEIVTRGQATGHVVAMIGDGVNDRRVTAYCMCWILSVLARVYAFAVRQGLRLWVEPLIWPSTSAITTHVRLRNALVSHHLASILITGILPSLARARSPTPYTHRSPALRRADMGIAMAITGSEVSREAASFVLLDDKFTSVIVGIRRGRTIFANMKKAIICTLGHITGEIMPSILLLLFGLPLGMSPFLILFIGEGGARSWRVSAV